MMVVYTADDFRRMALGEFPELLEHFAFNEGLIHVQMSGLAVVTETARAEKNWETYSRCIALVAELWTNPDDALLNALNVSYLEEIGFDGPTGKVAWDLLPKELQIGWKDMDDYLRSLSRDIWAAGMGY